MGTDVNKSQKSIVNGQKSEDGLVIFYLTDVARKLAESISEGFRNAEIIKYSRNLFCRRWSSSGKIICIMAAGIVVRAVAPLLKDKRTDPAVVVIDEKGRYAVSLLSGHAGGANALAGKIADYIGAQPVITTASDVQGKVSIDMWAAEENLYVEDFEKLKSLSMKIVNGHNIRVWTEPYAGTGLMPEEFVQVDSIDEAELIVSSSLTDTGALFLRPGNLFIGIGCNRGTSKDEIENVVCSVCRESGLSFHSVAGLATIDLKKDEHGLLEFAEERGLDINLFTREELNSAALIHGIVESEAVKAATGAAAVAEPSAMISAENHSGTAALMVPKQKRGNVTLAIAKAEYTL